MQKYYRESSNGTYTNRIIKDKKDNNPKIPSLFDIKVSVPPEFRGTENICKLQLLLMKLTDTNTVVIYQNRMFVMCYSERR